jgi:hypothetical protein
MLRLKHLHSPTSSLPLNQSQTNNSIDNSAAKSIEVTADTNSIAKIYATQQNSNQDKKSFEYTFASTTARLTKNQTSVSKGSSCTPFASQIKAQSQLDLIKSNSILAT